MKELTKAEMLEMVAGGTPVISIDTENNNWYGYDGSYAIAQDAMCETVRVRTVVYDDEQVVSSYIPVEDGLDEVFKDAPVIKEGQLVIIEADDKMLLVKAGSKFNVLSSRPLWFEDADLSYLFEEEVK